MEAGALLVVRCQDCKGKGVFEAKFSIGQNVQLNLDCQKMQYYMRTDHDSDSEFYKADSELCISGGGCGELVYTTNIDLVIREVVFEPDDGRNGFDYVVTRLGHDEYICVRESLLKGICK